MLSGTCYNIGINYSAWSCSCVQSQAKCSLINETFESPSCKSAARTHQSTTRTEMLLSGSNYLYYYGGDAQASACRTVVEIIVSITALNKTKG